MIEETTVQVNAPLLIGIGIALVLIMILIVLVKNRKPAKKEEKTEGLKSKDNDKEWIFN